MRVFLAPAPAPVSPLDAPARDAMVLGRTLGETMAAELAAAGLEVAAVSSLDEGEDRARREAEGAFVLLDSVLASREAIRRFVREARRERGACSVVCAVPRGALWNELSFIDGLDPADPRGGGEPVWTAPLYFLRGPGASRASSEPRVLPCKEQLLRFPLPRMLLGRAEEVVGVGDVYLCNVSHWVHVLRVNNKAIAGWWFDRLRWGGVLGPAWVAWRVLLGFPWVGGRLLESMRAVSFGASVHHKAHVELSVVRKGASIGSLTTIKNSFIDEGARIGDGAYIFGSVIGKGAFVAANTTVFGSVVYPGAFASQILMQLSILGRESCALITSNFFDVNFARNIRVPHRGRYVDSGARSLGVCVGPEARIGGGVWVASGREIPRGALIVKPAGPIVATIGTPEPGVPYAAQNGALVRARNE